MTNAEWIISKGWKFGEIRLETNWEADEDGIRWVVMHRGTCIGKLGKRATLLKWLDMEHKETVLDAVEKEYLGIVLKPFRNRIDYIKLVRAYNSPNAFVYVKLRDDYISFPSFKRDTKMYSGMEPGKAYTLEELGLYE